MARRYDSRTTIFSPEGRLFQVEYAMEAISNAGSALGVLAKDGVVLAAEKKITSKVWGPAQVPLAPKLLSGAGSASVLLYLDSDQLFVNVPEHCLVCSCLIPRLSACGERRCTSWTTMWRVLLLA